MSNFEPQSNTEKFPKQEKKEKSVEQAEIPEKSFETPAELESYGNEIESKVESVAQDFENSGNTIIDGVVASLDGGEEDIEAVKKELQPLHEEANIAHQEAHSKIHSAEASVLGEQWSNSARFAIESQSMEIDTDTKPYKSFGQAERFFIQKCRTRESVDVVAKISSPNESERKAIKKEGAIYDLLKRLREAAKEQGNSLEVGFPQKLDEFEHGEQVGLITNFIEDDQDAKNSLTPEQNTKLIATVLREMHKLPVPQEEIDKPYDQRGLEVLTGEEYMWRWRSFVPDLIDNGTLSQEDGDQLLATIEDNKDLINSFPLRMDHGDVHGGNIAYSVDAQTGSSKITLMDLEALKVANEFSGIAQMANREELAIKFAKSADRLKDMPHIVAQAKTAFDMLKGGGMTDQLENEFVRSNKEPEKAEQVYTLMRINELLGGLHDCASREKKTKGNLDEPTKIKAEIFQDILSEQLKKLKQIT